MSFLLGSAYLCVCVCVCALLCVCVFKSFSSVCVCSHAWVCVSVVLHDGSALMRVCVRGCACMFDSAAINHTFLRPVVPRPTLRHTPIHSLFSPEPGQ